MSQKDPIAASSKAGLDFSKIFYKTLDERRHLLGNIYQEDAVSWDNWFITTITTTILLTIPTTSIWLYS